MKLSTRCCLMALAFALTYGTASAQEAPQSGDSRWSDQIVVTVKAPRPNAARLRCPAMWKLSKGNSFVWVMPTLLTGKHSMSWDTSCFRKAIQGANLLVLQGDYVGIQSEKTYLPKGKTLKDVVSPETYARFVAAARRVHGDVLLYQSLRPQWAANGLIRNAYLDHGLENQTYPENMPGLARRAGMHTGEVELYTGGPELRNIRNRLDPKQGEACLNSVLDRLDYTLDTLPGVIDAWQKGNIGEVIAKFPREDNRCSPSDQPDEVSRENMNRWEQTLADLLSQPGRSVAAVPLNWLLYKGGALDQFKDAGVAILPPAGVEDELSNP